MHSKHLRDKDVLVGLFLISLFVGMAKSVSWFGDIYPVLDNNYSFGNTTFRWRNATFTENVTAEEFLGRISCTQLWNGTDTDFCVDVDTANTTQQITDVINVTEYFQIWARNSSMSFLLQNTTQEALFQATIGDTNITDTNASTSCSGFDVLFGDGTCGTPFNTTPDVRTAVNGTDLYYQIFAKDLTCSDCIGATEIDESSLVVQSGWINTSEEIEDEVGTMLTGNTETRITVDYQDADGTIDFVVEDMGNTSAQMVTAINKTDYYQFQSRNASKVVNATYELQLDHNTTEEMQDAVMDAIDGGTQTLITVTYQDASNDMDFVVDNNLHSYDWTNVVDADITDTLTCSIMNLGTSTFTGTLHGANITADSIDGAQLADTITLDASMHIDPSGNDYDFYVNNTNLFVDVSTNRVGIGTTTPDTLLEVEGADVSAIGLLHLDSSTHAYMSLDAASNAHDSGVYFSEAGTPQFIIGWVGASDHLRFRDYSGAATRMVIELTGNVGIGTTAPTGLLNINGTTNPLLNITNGTDEFVVVNNAGNVTFDTDTLFIDATNNRVGIGTTGPGAKLHVDGGAGTNMFRVNGSTSGDFEVNQVDATNLQLKHGTGATTFDINNEVTNGNLRLYATENITFRTATTDPLMSLIGDSGNVGIGTTDPLHELSVVGTANATAFLCGGGSACIDGGNITADSLSGTQIAELTDADISNTLTCSDLVAASEVVSDSEVADAITVSGAVWINTSTGINVSTGAKIQSETYCLNGQNPCSVNISFNGTNLILFG